jgi:uncharacterized membrane protein YphA (DoxX/SURF4 family)
MKRRRGTRIRPRAIARFLGATLLFAVLGWAGLAKLRDPAPAADFLTALTAIPSSELVVALAIGEIALALWLLSGAAAHAAATVAAALFTSFAVSHAYASFSPGAGGTPCGCLGASTLFSSMSAAGWIALNLACAGVAVVIAALAPPMRRAVARDRAETPASDSATEPTP